MQAILAMIVNVVNTIQIKDYNKAITFEQCFTHLRVTRLFKCFQDCTKDIIKNEM